VGDRWGARSSARRKQTVPGRTLSVPPRGVLMPTAVADPAALSCYDPLDHHRVVRSRGLLWRRHCRTSISPKSYGRSQDEAPFGVGYQRSGRLTESSSGLRWGQGGGGYSRSQLVQTREASFFPGFSETRAAIVGLLIA